MVGNRFRKNSCSESTGGGFGGCVCRGQAPCGCGGATWDDAIVTGVGWGSVSCVFLARASSGLVPADSIFSNFSYSPGWMNSPVLGRTCTSSIEVIIVLACPPQVCTARWVISRTSGLCPFPPSNPAAGAVSDRACAAQLQHGRLALRTWFEATDIAWPGLPAGTADRC